MSHLKKYLPLATLVFATTSEAGGFDNSGQPFDIILGFDNEISLTTVMTTATVEGTANSSETGNGNTAKGKIPDIFNDPTSTEVGLRFTLSDHVNCAMQVDEPYQINTQVADESLNYVDADGNQATGGPILNNAPGAESTPIATRLKSTAITLGCGYGFDIGSGRLTLFAGPKIEKLESTISADMLNSTSGVSGADDNLTYHISSASELGYVLGVGYEIEDYAMKVSLAYHSAVSHGLEGTATAGAGVNLALTGGSGVREGTIKTKIDTPAAVNLNIQSGFMPGWLAFIDLRWANYSALKEMSITSSDEPNFNTDLELFSSDTLDYTVGVGHSLTDRFALAASYSASTELDPKDLPSGVDGDTLRQPAGDTYTLAFGGRYILNDVVTIDGGLGYTVVKSFTIDNGSFRVDFDSTHAASIVAGLDFVF